MMPFFATVLPTQTLLAQAEEALHTSVWPQLEATALACSRKVLTAMQQARLGEEHFYCVTGYGHNDLGRDVLDAIYASALGAEAALVRPQFVSGTHAIAVALNACLQPGDLLLSLTGALYDTIEPVLGLREPASSQSLKGRGVWFEALNPFVQQNADDAEAPPVYTMPPNLPLQTEAEQVLVKQAKVIYLQRSKGYSLRPSLRLEHLKTLIAQAKALNPTAIVMVDNCYGEFIETEEPLAVGADLIIGSLIKNPGGGLAPTGAYIAGKAALVETCAERLTCPGIGSHGGYMAEQTRTFLQGLFLAPTVVKEALKNMSLAAYCFQKRGYQVFPAWDAPRADIIQTLYLQTPERLTAFCKAIQAASPVNAYLTPEPAVVPGYSSPVIMAGGTFIAGSSVELSADAPLRSPYALFLQGGLTYTHGRLALEQVLNRVS
jgi:cystathionine beta-lyase family protein involved in aluminum resistance